jgi:hypothetical protein
MTASADNIHKALETVAQLRRLSALKAPFLAANASV